MEIEIKPNAVCEKCGKVMENVEEGHADFCYDCEDIENEK